MKKKSVRRSERRNTALIEVTNILAYESLTKIAKLAFIVEASTNGLLLNIRREDLVPQVLRQNLNLDSIIGQQILIHLSQMNLELSGIITRTQLLGKDGYEVAVDYTADAPDYWRECLYDLLPYPGEMED